MDNILKRDLEFVRSIIPDCYQVSESRKKGSIHCVSNITVDGMSQRTWEEFKQKCHDYFEDRLQEFYHNVCTNHLDFTIYLRLIDWSKVGKRSIV